MQTHRHTGTQAHRHTDTQAHRRTDIKTLPCRCTHDRTRTKIKKEKWPQNHEKHNVRLCFLFPCVLVPFFSFVSCVGLSLAYFQVVCLSLSLSLFVRFSLLQPPSVTFPLPLSLFHTHTRSLSLALSLASLLLSLSLSLSLSFSSVFLCFSPSACLCCPVFIHGHHS